MAKNVGPIDFSSGIGNDTFNIGMTATWANIYFKFSGIKSMQGFIAGGNQVCYPADGESAVLGKAFRVKDTSGTVVFEGTWTNFSGNNVTFNKTTNTLGTPRAILEFGN